MKTRKPQAVGKTYLHMELAKKCTSKGLFFDSEDKALYVFLKAGIVPQILYAKRV